MRIFCRIYSPDGDYNKHGLVQVDAIRKNGNRYQARLAKSSENIPSYCGKNAIEQIKNEGIAHWFYFTKSHWKNQRLKLPVLENDFEITEVDEFQSDEFRKHRF